jgi:hypothetical protein
VHGRLSDFTNLPVAVLTVVDHVDIRMRHAGLRSNEQWAVKFWLGGKARCTNCALR